MKEGLNRIDLNMQRRTSQEKHLEERISSKVAVADEKRKVQIEGIADKAREHNQRVIKRVIKN